MFYVYILRSIKFSNRIYVGYTDNLKIRLAAHNAGKSKYTNKFKPWKIVTVICFSNKQQAIKFEKYLKSGSGVAFRNKHLI